MNQLDFIQFNGNWLKTNEPKDEHADNGEDDVDDDKEEEDDDEEVAPTDQEAEVDNEGNLSDTASLAQRRAQKSCLASHTEDHGCEHPPEGSCFWIFFTFCFHKSF